MCVGRNKKLYIFLCSCGGNQFVSILETDSQCGYLRETIIINHGPGMGEIVCRSAHRTHQHANRSIFSCPARTKNAVRNGFRIGVKHPYKIEIEWMVVKNNLALYFIFSFFKFIEIADENHGCSDATRFGGNRISQCDHGQSLPVFSGYHGGLILTTSHPMW